MGPWLLIQLGSTAPVVPTVLDLVTTTFQIRTLVADTLPIRTQVTGTEEL